MSGDCERYVASKKCMINVRDYGAKGNGADDDTSGVIEAFEASIGETIDFPKGDYRLTEKIKLGNRPITIMGEEKSLTRLRWEVVDGGIEFTGTGVSASTLW